MCSGIIRFDRKDKFIEDWFEIDGDKKSFISLADMWNYYAAYIDEKKIGVRLTPKMFSVQIRKLDGVTKTDDGWFGIRRKK